ncbi:tRNA (guanine-N(7)-)-methyltransferase isoform X2 [Melopsittacus undulatus]|uniref:tRNA (guanine-N(7)-)-methyltransferase isoform X1 n=1 Tax=Melopsittacus undulatus TaxID=13146 RepID=UPI00146B7B0A|nr:tRNA (guanine-N(7)-)-methyltransferase isoform X1 [Melopsittacus undulatus]XP_033927377.1 tRNA (guanine-N(7)-)-methyltransferase isoform X2 [Melopsittacus undulatus]
MADAPPQKRFYRQRAHANPLADRGLSVPPRPQDMDWASLFPDFFPADPPPGYSPPSVETLDVGCGYGGLLVLLSALFPQDLALGLELRPRVAAFTAQRIRSLRAQEPSRCQNVACVRGNAMRNLPHFFRRAQLRRLFFLFPDPHFKRTKHKWRIISPALLAEYGYVLRPGGLVYTVTDVPELHQWMVKHFREHPLFEEVALGQLASDPLLSLLGTVTEEGVRAQRGGRTPLPAVFRRLPDPPGA